MQNSRYLNVMLHGGRDIFAAFYAGDRRKPLSWKRHHKVKKKHRLFTTFLDVCHHSKMFEKIKKFGCQILDVCMDVC